MSLRYPDEISFLKEQISELLRYNDVILDDIVYMYYVYREPENVFVARRNSRKPSTARQTPKTAFSSLDIIGNQLVIKIFEALHGHNKFSNNENIGGKFNIVGKFKMVDESGDYVRYNMGDVVYFNGKTYIATRNTTGCTPGHKHPYCDSWKVIGLDDSVGYKESGF